jgi:hypothetical protein
MNTQTLLWTALPNGRTPDGGLRLSVHVSFRLGTDVPVSKPGASRTLNDYAEVLAWTTHVRDDLKLSVEFDNGPKVTLDDPAQWNGGLDPSRWKAMFTGSSPVEPYAPESLGKVPVISYPVLELEEFIRERYTGFVQGPGDVFPSTTSVMKAFEDASLFSYETTPMSGTMPGGQRRGLDQKSVQFLQGSLTGLATRSQARLRRNLDMMVRGQGMKLKPAALTMAQAILKDLASARHIMSAPGSTTKSFMAFSMFHAPMEDEGPKKPISVLPQITEIEFHEAVSSLGDYPGLMRVLGLVIDVVVPASAAIPASSFVWVKPQWKNVFNDAATVNFSPKTKYAMSAADFAAAPRTGASGIVNGLLDLSDTGKFDIVQLDVDGAAMKIKALMATIEQGTWEDPPTGPVMLADAGGAHVLNTMEKANAVPINAYISLPSLRTQGISLVRRDQSTQLVARVDAQIMYNGNLSYAVAHPSILKKALRTTLEAEKSEVRLYAEDLVRGHRIDAWSATTTSWYSLCKRKTLVSFSGKPALLHTETTEGYVGLALTAPAPADGEPENTTPDEMRLSENLCRWDGWSLVAPRPGKRVNDNDEVEDNDNPPVTFTKMSARTEAEPGSLPRLRFGRSYRLRARIVDLAGNGRALDAYPAGDMSRATRESVFARLEPVASPLIVLRTAAKPGESVERIVLRSNYDVPVATYLKDHGLADPLPERHILAPRTSEQMAEYHGKFDGMPPADAYTLITSFEGFPAKLYAAADVELPYLPDPLAHGVALTFFWNGKPIGEPQYFEFLPGSNTWPRAHSIRIRVEEHDTTATVEKSGARLLVIRIPKAGVVTVRYSSYLDAEGAEVIALARWVAEKSGPAAAAVKEAAMKGRHWMITPFRDLTIVHATQQPMLEPVVGKLVPVKTAGATFAMINGRVDVHGRSTDRCDVLAHWSEPLDDLTLPEWKMVDGSGQAFSVPVKETDTSLLLGDQKVSTQSPGMDISSLMHTPPVTPGGYPSITDEKVYAPVTTLVSASAHGAQRHDFGDTKYRKISYTFAAVSRFREHFLDLLPSLSEGKAGAAKVSFTREYTKEAVILSSARPHVPKVKYCVPTFQWERKEDQHAIISRRCGGGIRVFLDRPWFSSGDGELLGVVIRPGGVPLNETNEEDNRFRPFVTQWGLDPLVRSSGTIKAAPTLSDFRDTERKQGDVYLDELPKPVGTADLGAMEPLQVAGYKPVFDKERKMWFADVVLDPGAAYFPFIRLALVRFQPNSIGGMHLSPVVLTDFIQVVPDRVAAVTFDAADKLTVQVAGIFGSRTTAPLQPLNVLDQSTYLTATLEKKVGQSDFGWVPVAAPAVTGPPAPQEIAERMKPTQLHDTKMRWVREIPLQEPVTKGSGSHRIVIREFEVHRDAAGEVVPRLVYADAVEL